jgi:3-oxoacyl-[acyl-carrier protein] reductase
MKHENRIAIVTGAAGNGMGRSIALTLARDGAKVVVNYRTSKDSANQVVNHIKSNGGTACAICADIQEKEACKDLVAKTIEFFGRVDICVIGPGGGWHMEPIDKLDAENALLDVSQELAPIYYLIPMVLPGMIRQQWGRIIAISLEPGYGSPAYAYNVAKAARTNAVILAQNQVWEKGVTMNVIGPGLVVEISTFEEAVEQSQNGDAWVKRDKTSPQDIAETVSFLCSDAGRFITGCVVPFK